MRLGTIVRYWFDTGAMGVSILSGVVEKSGPKTYTVRWESGIRNRVENSNPGVTPEKDPELIAEARRKLALPKACVEDVVEAFVEHHEEMRTAYDALVATGPLTETKVAEHSAVQKALVESFDAWLLAAGWTRSELWEALRGIAREIRRRGGP